MNPAPVINWLLIGAIGIGAAAVGWFGYEFREGQQAKDDLQEAKDASAALTTSLTQAALEADKLKEDMGDIANRLEDALNENAARARTSTAAVRATVAATPSLATGRLPREFVELYNATRRGHGAGAGTTSGGAGSDAAGVVPASPRDASGRPR